MNKSQFEFKFTDVLNNSFKRAVSNGEFYTLFQICTPESDCNIDAALNRANPFIREVEEIEDINCGVALYNGNRYRDNVNIVNFASALKFKDTNKHVLFLSGRGKREKDMIEAIDASLSFGFKNIIPVSGFFYDDDDNEKSLKNEPFYDSARSVSLFGKYFGEVHKFPGAVINPYKYTPNDLYPQYFKLIKKIKAGANYIFTQTGWDLLKLQELRWYLEKRNLYIPTIATLYFLKPDYIEKIITGRIPGVAMSPDFLAILRKEARIGIAQFMAAQWRKLQLMISGVRLMGYSGVLIEGLDRSSDVKVAQHKIKEAFEEFKTFDDWKVAYTEYLARAEMAPYPYRYYMYSNLFDGPYADNAKESFIKIDECSRKEKLSFDLSQKLWKNKLYSSDKSIIRKIVYKCSSCDEEECSLHKLFWNCHRKCPKKLINGPCGDTNSDGSCFLTQKECLFGKVFRMANMKKQIDKLEDKIH